MKNLCQRENVKTHYSEQYGALKHVIIWISEYWPLSVLLERVYYSMSVAEQGRVRQHINI